MAVEGIFAPREDTYSDRDAYVGTFRSGEVKKGRPVTLDYFRVTCEEPDVAEMIAEQFGGEALENESEREPLQIYTRANRVNVEFESIDTGFKVFANNVFVRSCDGSVQTGGDQAGQPCSCAGMTKDERVDYAKKGGCKPSIQVVFRLVDMPELGLFRFNSGAWSLLESVQRTEKAVDLARDDGRKLQGFITLDKVTTKAGRDLTLPKVTLK